MRFVKALVLIAVIALAVPQMAAAADMKHSLGLSAGYFGPTGDLSTNFLVGEAEIPATLELASTGVVGLAYQYRFNEKFSLGASLLYANPDFRVSSTEASGRIGNALWMPLLIDGNFHVLKNTAKVDFYVGATVGYAMWGDFQPDQYADTIGITESSPLKDNFVYGANFGLDVPFKVKWAFNTNLRYLLDKAEPDTEGAQSIDVNPWIITVGVSYRF